jgi:hypothetical protein
MNRRRSRRNEERRRHIFIVLLKLILGGGAFGLLIFYAYEVGYRVNQGELTTLREQVSGSQEQAAKAREQADGDRAALNELRKQDGELRALYEQSKPSDDLKDLMVLVRTRMADGMEPKRLAFVIKSAPVPRQCEVLPVKRFLVRTPKAKAPNAAGSAHLDDQLELSADGIGGNDGREQWFDPDRPLRLHVAGGASRMAEISGKLPIEQAVLLRPGLELHYTVTASVSRGYADVASERCELK